MPTPEQSAVDLTQTRFITHVAIARPDLLDLQPRDLKRLFTRQLELRGSIDSAHNAAHPIVLHDQHGLCCFVTGATLRADIVGWCEGERVTIPKRSMIAGVIVRVADKYVEYQPPIQLMQGRARLLEMQAEISAKSW